MPKQLTVRGVSPELGRRLAEISRTRGKSLNATVLEILEGATGIDQRLTWLSRFMTWGPEDVRAMEEASGYDLTQFRRWYEQAGTPRIQVRMVMNTPRPNNSDERMPPPKP